MTSERHYPGGADYRAARALARWESTGHEPTTLLRVFCSCPKAHEVARLLKTAEGPVITGRSTPVTLSFDSDGVTRKKRGRCQSVEVAVLLDLLDDNQAVLLDARCQRFEIRAAWFRACRPFQGHSAVYAER